MKYRSPQIVTIKPIVRPPGIAPSNTAMSVSEDEKAPFHPAKSIVKLIVKTSIEQEKKNPYFFGLVDIRCTFQCIFS